MNFNLQNYVKIDSMLRRTYKSNKMIFKDNVPPFRLPKSTKIASWRPLGTSWNVLEASWGVLGASWSARLGLLGSFLGASGSFVRAKTLVSSAGLSLIHI